MKRGINVEDVAVVRTLRARIRQQFGEESATAFLEAIANVRDHCADKRCTIQTGIRGWQLTDHGTGVGSGEPGKSHNPDKAAEGGYGLAMILALGGQVISTPQGTTVRWRCPVCNKPNCELGDHPDCTAG